MSKRENSDNAEMVRTEVRPVVSLLQCMELSKIDSYKNEAGEWCIVVIFGNGGELRLALSVEQANELAIKLGFVLQDIESEDRRGNTNEKV